METDKVIVVAPHWRGPEFQPVYLQLADRREHLSAPSNRMDPRRTNKVEEKAANFRWRLKILPILARGWTGVSALHEH